MINVSFVEGADGPNSDQAKCMWALAECATNNAINVIAAASHMLGISRPLDDVS